VLRLNIDKKLSQVYAIIIRHGGNMTTKAAWDEIREAMFVVFKFWLISILIMSAILLGAIAYSTWG